MEWDGGFHSHRMMELLRRLDKQIHIHTVPYVCVFMIVRTENDLEFERIISKLERKHRTKTELASHRIQPNTYWKSNWTSNGIQHK